MLKKIIMLSLVYLPISLLGAQAPTAPAVQNKKLTLDIVTRIKPLQAIILGYLDTYEEMRTEKIHADMIALSPDGKYAALSYSGALDIYEIPEFSKKITCGSRGFDQHILFSRDNREIIATGFYTTKIWQGSQLIRQNSYRKNHREEIMVQAISATPNGKRLVITLFKDGEPNLENTPQIIDTTTFCVICELKGHTDRVTAITNCPNDTCVVTGDLSGNIKIWDAGTGNCVQTIIANQQNQTKSGGEKIHSVALSPTGTQLANSLDKTLKIWDMKNYQPIQTLTMQDTDTGNFSQIAYAPGTDLFVAYSNSGIVYIWDTKSWKLHTISCNNTSFNYYPGQLSFSQNGLYLGIRFDGMIKLLKNQAVEIRLADAK